MSDASYPEDLLYHPEHDWARVEGDRATLGITWYAQDRLGEVVFYDGGAGNGQVVLNSSPANPAQPTGLSQFPKTGKAGLSLPGVAHRPEPLPMLQSQVVQ